MGCIDAKCLTECQFGLGMLRPSTEGGFFINQHGYHVFNDL